MAEIAFQVFVKYEENQPSNLMPFAHCFACYLLYGQNNLWSIMIIASTFHHCCTNDVLELYTLLDAKKLSVKEVPKYFNANCTPLLYVTVIDVLKP